MAHTLGVHFEKLLANIRPPSDRFDTAVELHPLVTDFLKNQDVLAVKYPYTRLAGSYAQFLTVGDVKDVDMLLRVPGDPDDNDPPARDVLSDLYDTLLNYTDENGGDTDFDVEKNRRSVHLWLKDQDFHFDIVPCIAPDGFDKAIWVPDWGYKVWIESDPLGVVNLVSDLEADYPDKFRSLAKLFKHFRNTQMTYMKPKSYWLVSLAIKAVRSGRLNMDDPLAVIFNQLLSYTYDRFEAHLDKGTVPKIADPMLGHNVAWKWEFSHFKRFMTVLNDGIGWSDRALATDDKGKAIELWQKVFGLEFEADVSKYARSLAAAGLPSVGAATSTGLIIPNSGQAKRTAVPATRFYGKQ